MDETPHDGDGALQVWINQGDIVLLSLRDFQDDKADVIVKYTADEARNCTYLEALHVAVVS
jgi:initiation factor 1A